MPLTNVTTAITAATPITTPSKVSAERSLFAHNDRNAILMASVTFIGQGAGVRSQSPGHLLLAAGPLSGYQFNSPTLDSCDLPPKNPRGRSLHGERLRWGNAWSGL